MEKILKQLAFIFITLLMFSLCYGFVIYFFWDWFVSPLLNMNEISILRSLGLGLLISTVTQTYRPVEPLEARHGNMYAQWVAWSLIAIGIGFVVYQLMVRS